MWDGMWDVGCELRRVELIGSDRIVELDGCRRIRDVRRAGSCWRNRARLQSIFYGSMMLDKVQRLMLPVNPWKAVK